MQAQHLHWEQGYLVQTLRRMRRAVEVPVCAIDNWERENGRRIARLILIPHRFLHLVPLHAVPLPDGRLWGDVLPIQYAPSASTLFRLFCRAESVIVTDRKAVAVAYSPSAGIAPPLLFHAAEAKAVADVTGGQVIAGQEATASRVCEAMREAAYIHFACHGAYDPDNPLNSGLDLAPDNEASTNPPAASANGRLTLARIVERVHLAQAPLVVLSACETGIPKIETADEYIGLPAGFFLAGARLVVSTLWPIPDLATWLLMRRFAGEIAWGSNATTALGSAQQYLRQLRSEDVIHEICDASAAQNDKRRGEQIFSTSAWLEQAEPYPFRSPYWWAGFTVNGLDDPPKEPRSSRSPTDYETVNVQ